MTNLYLQNNWAEEQHQEDEDDDDNKKASEASGIVLQKKLSEKEVRLCPLFSFSFLCYEITPTPHVLYHLFYSCVDAGTRRARC